MRIAIATPTGHVGRRLTEILLESGDHELVLLARDPSKVEWATDAGAHVETGTLTDGAYVERATAGADALFWVCPPDYAYAGNYLDYLNGLGEVAAAAVRANGIQRVVSLSSAGAQVPSGIGPVSGLYRVEKALEATGANVVHLRAGFFMENTLFHLGSIKAAGAVFQPLPPDVAVPHVATRDIGDVAARWIADPSWTGTRAVGVHGPEDLSHRQIVEILGEVLGRPIQYVHVTPEQARFGMQQLGLGAGLLNGYLELYDAMATGRFQVAEPRTPETTTASTFRWFAEEMIRPLL